ncbi:MAG: DNA replication complex GINS family protein [Candidatus Aenigmarchaeota archaeon]|nr:DNA replication complex GINS family protein [Candidatus Aenigmarchaeota archaeon]
MITYETLRKIERDERVSNKLAQLPERFLFEVQDYLRKKEAMSREKGDRWELQTAKQRFENIMQLRERKIINFTLSFVRSGAMPENMVPEEREMFDSIAKRVKEFQDKREKAMTGEKASFKTVAFLQQLPQFVGIDMGYYGPYQQGDIATVPADNAMVLVEKGAAELVEGG